MSVSALFGLLEENQTTLAVTVDGFGQVTASPSRNVFDVGELVTLSATPDPGHQFLGWDATVEGEGSIISLKMNQSQEVRARFSSFSDDSVILSIVSLAPFTFQFNTQVGRKYSIETSNDLESWVPLKTVIGRAGASVYSDDLGEQIDERYFRVKVGE
ncbi:hypothetical protein N8612_05645 [Verrucomicrobia bacterium]|nr:hypothetical protein [Verrucomicrobiota bacterium]